MNEKKKLKDDFFPPFFSFIENSAANGSNYVFNREVRTAQRTIKELERRLNELTTEIENAKQATTESMNLNKTHARRIQSLETELSQAKKINDTLMEEIEGYRILLHEKTMKGEFMLNPIVQVCKIHKHVYMNILFHIPYLVFICI